MLNISSNNNIECQQELKGLKAFNEVSLSPRHLTVRNLLLTLLGLFLIFLFLPWTQNVRGEGNVTTLRPEQRPQTIHSTISGRIEKWYVTEGQLVKKGDTIVYISEVKAEYFDPGIVGRVDNQVSAKEGSITAYGGKIGALDDQIAAMVQEQENKLKQINNKIRQGWLKVASDSMKIIEANLEVETFRNQFDRAQQQFDKQLISLTQLQNARVKFQDAQTKTVSAVNQFEISKNELLINQRDFLLAQNEYANKIAKARSDQFSTVSDQFDAEASVNKLRIERENYARRQSFYYIIAPQDCYIIKAVMPGIGEIIKEGEPVVSILPSEYQLAVELYVKPMDLPLLAIGQKVRFTFDGWPSFFFSGWPGASVGTFAGRIAAIDRNISTNGKFRVLVGPDSDPKEQQWPSLLQVGGGAYGIALLNNVPMWYELWRILNGFPPDRYFQDEINKGAKDPLPKAPIKNAK